MHISELIEKKVAERYKSQLSGLPQYFFYHSRAAQSLVQVLSEITAGKSALIFSDKRTRLAAGEKLYSAFEAAGWHTEEMVIPDEKDGTSPRCDDITKNTLQARIPEADIYIALGSGVVNDLTKWLAAEMNKPYGAFATAASMNGYASANVAPAIKGVKSIFAARGPYVIAADPLIIAGAGPYLTSAGLGDVIAKPVSTADWLLNHLVFGEVFSAEIAGLIADIEPAYLERPEEIAKGDHQALGELLKALVLSGCAMTLQGSSLPASGGEHLISHTLDMKAYIENKHHDLHGRQVGVATIFVAALYQKIMAMTSLSVNESPLSLNTSYWGDLIDAVQPQHERACMKIKKAARELASKQKWTKVKKALAPQLRRPEVVKHCLKSAGAAHRLADIGCNKDAFYQAVCNCPSMRERFTAIDLGYLVGLLPQGAEQIIDDWLV